MGGKSDYAQWNSSFLDWQSADQDSGRNVEIAAGRTSRLISIGWMGLGREAGAIDPYF
jgi:hypothetical protein